MPLNQNTQTVIAFKNISGKSNTDESLKTVNNEAEGIFFNVDSGNVWLDKIYATPSYSILQGSVVGVTASMVYDTTSNNHAYFAVWPATPPSGLDVTTGNSYAYGLGVLSKFQAGDRIRNAVSPSYNVPPTPGYDIISYTGDPGTSGNQIFPGDPRSWYYQYNSGVFYQQDVSVIPAAPVISKLYVYVGKDLRSASEDPLTNIRITAYGVDAYTASATPILGTYSSDYIYLVDFINGNTSGTVSLNIDGLGPINLVKFQDNDFTSLVSGDIVGATASPIYYLTYNGLEFQLFNSNPSQQPLTYTNLLGVPEAIGGFEIGETFSDVSHNTLWTTLLYPSALSMIESLGVTGPVGFYDREVGDSLAPGSYTFSWNTTFPANVKPDTLFLNQRSPTYSLSIISGTSNTGTLNVTLGTVSLVTPGSYTYSVGFSRNNGTVEISEIATNWRYKIYYGSSTQSILSSGTFPDLTYNRTEIDSFGYYDLPKGVTNSYKYIALPDSFPNIEMITYYGLPLITADSGDGYTMSAGNYNGNYTLLNVQNAFGVFVDYRIYRSKNILGATLSNVKII